MRVFVVREGDDGPLASVLEKMGADPRALADGRVFIGKKRVYDASLRVKAGDEVRAGAPRANGGLAHILVARDGWVAADKPAGVPTIGDHAGDAHALSAQVLRSLGRRAPEGLHTTSRLDRFVSGVVVFTTSDEARARIKALRDTGKYERRYVAIASSAPKTESGEWTAPIGRAKNARLRMVNGKDATTAKTRYRVIARAGAAAMLALVPVTGRTHQLRVHAAHAGAPLLGDKDYGGQLRITLDGGAVVRTSRVALHCARVRLHFDEETVPIESNIPEDLRNLWVTLGGQNDAWELARSIEIS